MRLSCGCSVLVTRPPCSSVLAFKREGIQTRGETLNPTQISPCVCRRRAAHLLHALQIGIPAMRFGMRRSSCAHLEQVAALHQRNGHLLLLHHPPDLVHCEQHRRRGRQPQQLLHRLQGRRDLRIWPVELLRPSGSQKFHCESA